MSKAEIARRIGKHPASVRRLFTAQINPEFKTIMALAQRVERGGPDSAESKEAGEVET